LKIQSSWYSKDGSTLPAVSASAVRDKDGHVHIALVNVDPHQPATITAQISGGGATGVTGRVLTARAMNAHNAFQQPATAKPAAFTGAAIESNTLKATLPPKSVVVLELK
jgi:alpha-N-arabinofuranosidase